MNELRQILIRHGAPLVFGTVLLEQMGVPLPAVPWLLAAGALSVAGDLGFFTAILVAVLACLLADAFWFQLGRRRGIKVLKLLCKITLEPDSCVRRTQNIFTKYGWRGILVAKFIPGLSAVVPPLAGISSMNAARFLALDGVGAFLYVGTYVSLGYIFANQLEQIAGALANIGGSAVCLVIGLVAAYLGYKFWQRHKLLHELRIARVTVEEVRRLLNSGRPLVLLDVRSALEFTQEPGLPGAVHLSLEDVKQGRFEIPKDREVIVYCSCPNEVTAARVALLLRHHGFHHVRPLLGGIEAWREQPAPITA